MNTVKTLLDRPLFSLGGTTVTTATLLLTAVVVLLTLAVAQLSRRWVKRAFNRRGVQKAGTADAVGKLLQYVLLVIGFSIALQTAGVKLSALFAAGAVFAVGLGFAMQTIVQNFVSGVILLVERSITPGDIVDLKDQPVRVEQMRIRSTIVKTLDGEDMVVPNSQLVQATVKNFTLKENNYRVRIKVGVVYSSDMLRVQACLLEALQALPFRVEGRDAEIFLNEFGNNAVVFEVAVWTDDPWAAPRHRSEMHWAIWQRFAAEEIVIAFPQVDVHFDPPVSHALASLAQVKAA